MVSKERGLVVGIDGCVGETLFFPFETKACVSAGSLASVHVSPLSGLYSIG